MKGQVWSTGTYKYFILETICGHTDRQTHRQTDMTENITYLYMLVVKIISVRSRDKDTVTSPANWTRNVTNVILVNLSQENLNRSNISFAQHFSNFWLGIKFLLEINYGWAKNQTLTYCCSANAFTPLIGIAWLNFPT